MKRRWLLFACLACAGCATVNFPTRVGVITPQRAEQQAVRDLHIAQLATSQLGTSEGRQRYNDAVGDLTVLLRSANHGVMWNHPLSLESGRESYRLHYATSAEKGFWSPETFTDFAAASKVPSKTIRRRDVHEGVGAALVGIRKKTPAEPFAPLVGVTGAVTATVEFRGYDATLTLRDPGERSTARIGGVERPLQSDLSAPLAYYPAVNQTWTGLMGAMRVNAYMSRTGLYLLQPYDSHRIPLIFVHGLISTPQLWRNVINELEMDPELRGRYQCWVFAYPTGNPYAYSAMRFREELDKARKIYGFPHGIVVVGHSMGGLLTHMQAVTLTQADWARQVGPLAGEILKRTPAESILHNSVLFNANPDIRRIVYICTPHRGSDMVLGWVGRLGMRLISLPASVAGRLTSTLGNDVEIVSGDSKLLPNGVTCLSPRNPTLKVMNNAPMRAPFHSIIGDRGRGDTPNSSDGVVAYWSSHLDGAQSEKIVPGPHSSCELPQTIDELKRILKLHLKTAR